MESKVCSKCGHEKPLEAFFKQKGRKYGVTSHCKECKREACLQNLESIKHYKALYYLRNKESLLEKNREYRRANNEAVKLRDKKRYELGKEQRLLRNRIYNRKNRDNIKEQRAAYYRKNREAIVAQKKIYKQNNRAMFNARNRARDAKKIQATPAWLTPHDFDMIAMFYEAAADQKQYGLTCHVDHIVPLQGKEVCGLHVPWNLQVLPASENIRKGNRLK